MLCTTPIFGLCSHCPSRSTLLCTLSFWGTLFCTTLWCTVLCIGSDSGFPFWSSVLCTTHHGHYASVQPFLGHCALQCPFLALCSARPLLGFALYCPSGALCSAMPFLGVVFFTLSFLGTVTTSALLGCCAFHFPSEALSLFSALLGHCAFHLSYGAVFCTAPLRHCILYCPS